MSPRAIGWLLKTAASAYVKDNVPRLGAAVSYYTVFAVSPLFIIVIFIASLWFNKVQVQAALFTELGSLLGKQGAGAIQSALNAAAPHSQGVLATSIAIGTLLLSATGLFVELQSDLNTIWGVEPRPGMGVWGFVRDRLLSFAMVVAIGFLLLVSLVVNAMLSAAGKYLATFTPDLATAWHLVNSTVSLAVITVLFALIFKVLPDVRITWREVWIGAFVTALLFTLGKFLLGLYLGRNSTISAYGAAGSLVLILIWVYYSAQILFFGAELTQAYANRFGARLSPKTSAQWISPRASAPAERMAKPRVATPLDRKAQLVSELKTQVENLRATVQQTQADMRGSKS